MFHRMVGARMEANLEEFEDAREVVAALSEEYAAAESSDYVSGPARLSALRSFARGVCTRSHAHTYLCACVRRHTHTRMRTLTHRCTNARTQTRHPSTSLGCAADRPRRRRGRRPGGAAGQQHAAWGGGRPSRAAAGVSLVRGPEAPRTLLPCKGRTRSRTADGPSLPQPPVRLPPLPWL